MGWGWGGGGSGTPERVGHGTSLYSQRHHDYMNGLLPLSWVLRYDAAEWRSLIKKL